MTDLFRLPATAARAGLHDGSFSAVELMAACLGQIEKLDPRLRAFISVCPEEALAGARAADERIARGEARPLEGLPLAVKDIIPTAGLRTTFGSLEFENHVPEEDASVVARLKAAGAVVIGKTSTPEFGAYINTRNALVGTTLNAWAPEWSSGGSSGGTAVAVATGMAPLGLGTDFGGSIRFPATMNGIAGLRPTPGLVPAWPSAWPFDTYAATGPMCRTVADLDLVMRVIGRGDRRSPLPPPIPYQGCQDEQATALRIGWTEDLGGLFPVDPDVRDVLRTARRQIEGLGLDVTDEFPDLSDVEKSIVPLRKLRALIQHDKRLHRAELLENRLLSRLIQETSGTLMAEAAAAEVARSAGWLEMARFFERFDVLALPSTQMVGFRPDQDTATEIDGKPVPSALHSALSTYLLSMLGVPALAIPCGFSPDGRPVGLQLVAAPGRDATLLALGMMLERRLGWTDIFPPLAGGAPR